MPVLRLLKRHNSANEIYWWLSDGLVPLLRDDPDLAGVIPFHRRQWRSPLNWPHLMGSILELKTMRFDLVIDLQSLLRSALFAWAAQGALTVGLADPREGAPAFYDYAIPRPSAHTHAVDWYLQVLNFLKVPIHWDFEWLPPHPALAANVSQRRQAQPLVILLPGARWPNKRWPIEHFCELAKILSRNDSRLRLAVLGGREDMPLGEQVRRAAPEAVWDLTGRTELPEMVEWIRQAEVVVSNDTGPMHVAAALGKPVVALFGPTHPDRTGPYTPKKEVIRATLPCVPCMRARCANPVTMACLWRITPASVAAAAGRFLPSGLCG